MYVCMYVCMYVQYLFKKNRTVYEIMWKNIIDSGRPQMTL